MANTLLLIAMHPEIQERVYLEINRVTTHEVFHDDLKDLVYMEMVIKESLRFIPLVPVVARKSTAEVELGEFVKSFQHFKA